MSNDPIVVFEASLPEVKVGVIYLPEMKFIVGVADAKGTAKKFFKKYPNIREIEATLSKNVAKLKEAIDETAQKRSASIVAAGLTEKAWTKEVDEFYKNVLLIVEAQLSIASNVAQDILVKYAKADSDFDKYAFEMTKEVAIGAGTIAIHSAGIATSVATFGATSIVHFMGLFKGLATISKSLDGVFTSTDATLAALNKAIKDLQKKVAKFNKDDLHKAEHFLKVTAHAFMHSWLGVDIYPTLKKAHEEALKARGKVGYKLIKAAKLSEVMADKKATLNHLKEQRQKLEKSKQLNAVDANKKIDKTIANIEKLEAEIQKCMTRISYCEQRYRTTNTILEHLETLLEALEPSCKTMEKSEKWTELFASLLLIPVSLGDAEAPEKFSEEVVKGVYDFIKDEGLEKVADALQKGYEKLFND